LRKVVGVCLCGAGARVGNRNDGNDWRSALPRDEVTYRKCFKEELCLFAPVSIAERDLKIINGLKRGYSSSLKEDLCNSEVEMEEGKLIPLLLLLSNTPPSQLPSLSATPAVPACDNQQ